MLSASTSLPTPTLMADRPPHLRGTDIAIYEEDGTLYALDDYGEFEVDPPRGSKEPMDGRCGAKLKLSVPRYGELRYCTQTPYWPSDDSDEEASEFCKTHKDRDYAMKNAIDSVEHGYFSQNYAVFEQALDTHEFLFAVQIFAGLLEMSKYEFDVETVVFAIDASGDDLIESDEVAVEIPFPRNIKYQMQANELWYASLDEIVEKRMQDIRLTEGVSGEHVVAHADEDGVITDTIREKSEHHLNLPISRLTKDKKERLKIGGVEIGADDDGGFMSFGPTEYVLDVGPDEELDDLDELEQTLTAELEDDE